jgi:hypothetical protein
MMIQQVAIQRIALCTNTGWNIGVRGEHGTSASGDMSAKRRAFIQTHAEALKNKKCV